MTLSAQGIAPFQERLVEDTFVSKLRWRLKIGKKNLNKIKVPLRFRFFLYL
ncbi:MAG: hypothetical protein ACI8PB_005296 [Desulforhopalus sp.]|jgi:hypothetical protein